MDQQTKVTFTLSIGYQTAKQEDIFTLAELGYDPKFDKDLDEFLEDKWMEWKDEFVDGSWQIVESVEGGESDE